MGSIIEKILNFSIQNRFFIFLITCILALYGIYALQQLPIDAVPDITNNQVQINTTAPGFSPYEVEKQVTFPIENALTEIPGLESTRSISRNAFSQVTAIFDEHVDIYFARQQISQRLQEAKEFLPEGVDPAMGPISTGLGEIYMWTVEFTHPGGEGANKTANEPGWQPDGSYLTAEGQKLQNEVELASYLRTVQDWIIAPQLKQLRGIAAIDSIGGYTKQYHVEPDPKKMIAYQIGFNEILDALDKNNSSVGAGYIEKQQESFLVRADGRLGTPKDIENIVIASRKGTPIYLKDIAHVAIGKELRTGSATENGEEVVIGTAMMLIGENSRKIAQAVDQKIKEVNRNLPPDIRAKTVLNRTKLVDSTIKTVTQNLVEGAILVIVVLFLMLGNFRAACITALIIPLSMLATAIGMVKTEVSGNLMSLGALDFGLIVDGTIIIAENCLRRLGERQHALGRILTLPERLEEVKSASKEMIQPTVYGQAIILTVYFPLLTLTGIEGKMFVPMATTVIIALISAFILSITFTPAMIAIFIKGRVHEKENLLVTLLKKVYQPFLNISVACPKPMIGSGLVLVIASYFLFIQLGQEFIPTLDEEDIALQAMRIPSTSLTQSTSMQRQLEKTLTELPEVAFVFSKTGTAEMASDPMPPNLSDTFVILKPKNEWPNPNLPKPELIHYMEHILSKLPGNNYEFTQPIEMRFNELIAGVRSDVAVKIYGDDFEKMTHTASNIFRSLADIKGTADLKVSQTHGLPLLTVNIDRDKTTRMGLNSGDILNVIQIAIGGAKAGDILEGDRRFDIVVRLPETIRNDVEALGQIPIVMDQIENHRFPYVPLREVALFKETEGLNEITRENGKRLVIVQTNVRGKDLGSYINEAKNKIDQEVKLPPGYWLEWGGQFQHLLSAREHLMIVIPICFALIFLLLYSAFQSVTLSLLVFSGIPMALTGGIAALWFREIPFSISSAVGFIALSGIAVLNGLVMISYIRQLQQQGLNIEEAIIQGALTRLRPVMMTALVASLGFLPMALATGTGAEVQKPLATVVIGGLISSTILTLIILPALCRIFFRRV